MTYSSTGPLPASVNCAALSFRCCIFYSEDVPSQGLAVTWRVRRPFYFWRFAMTFIVPYPTPGHVVTLGRKRLKTQRILGDVRNVVSQGAHYYCVT